ncbi:MAG: saccharopine dehydrogenase [Desulfobacteraceae bacterium]|nr:saccharopine dehydrogenase [Desulfobacteraceae bacterium]
MKKITILGAGLVGKCMAIDLCHDYDVTSADRDVQILNEIRSEHPINTIEADFKDPQKIREVIKEADLVVGAVPGFMGFEMLKAVITAGKNIADISFFPEDPFELDELAKKHDVTAVVDCGVAPGMGNIILGYHNEHMTVDKFTCYVGGLPKIRSWPFEYKAPFSPIDVIEEYTRPARIVKNGNIEIMPALSEPELLEFNQVGTLEAFNTDGLRTVLKTMSVPNMIEKTLRYPRHIELIRVFRELGFFDDNPIDIKGTAIKPIDLTSTLLFKNWKLEKNDEEFTVMKVIVEGEEKGKSVKHEYDLLDRYDQKTQMSSMARTTGYTCTGVSRLIADGRFVRKGICPPEYVGAAEGCFQALLDYLKERGVFYTKH